MADATSIQDIRIQFYKLRDDIKGRPIGAERSDNPLAAWEVAAPISSEPAPLEQADWKMSVVESAQRFQRLATRAACELCGEVGENAWMAWLNAIVLRGCGQVVRWDAAPVNRSDVALVSDEAPSDRRVGVVDCVWSSILLCDELLGAAVPSTAPKADSTKIPETTLADTVEWPNVEISVLSDFSIQPIVNRRHRQVRTFAEMGLGDGRKGNKVAIAAWDLLVEDLALKREIVSPINSKECTHLEKRVQRLREAIRGLIPEATGDPLPRDPRGRRWVPAFRISRLEP